MVKYFSEEIKQSAVKLVASGRSVSSVAKEYGCDPSSIRNWLQKARVGDKQTAMDATNKGAEKTQALIRRVAELEEGNKLLSKTIAWLMQEVGPA